MMKKSLFVAVVVVVSLTGGLVGCGAPGVVAPAGQLTPFGTPQGGMTKEAVPAFLSRIGLVRLLTTITFLKEDFAKKTGPCKPFFSDVAADDRCAIEVVRDRGVIFGDEGSEFRPNTPINWAEFAKVVVATFSYPPPDEDEVAKMGIVDNEGKPITGAWFAGYLAVLVKLGLLNKQLTFNPADTITEQEARELLQKMQAQP